MSYTPIARLQQHVGGTVTVAGWLTNLRSSGKIAFLQLRDGSGFVQGVVAKNDVAEEVFERARHLTQECSVLVTGSVRADERAPSGVELAVTGVEVVGESTDYPITPKEHGVDFLMDNRHLWLRSTQQWAILRVRATVVRAIRNWLDGQGFTLVDAPILTPAACEGTTTLFETEYFGDKAYLTQSGQLYNEAAIAAFGRTYCFGPTFRAEKSKTRRHLIEFWMVEPEMAYADLDECMRVEEEFVSHIVQTALHECAEELKVLERDTAALEAIVPPFPRISYTEALEILREAGETLPWGEDFGAPHETAVSDHFGKPVFVHRYPAQCKAFYMEADPEDERLSLSVDLLAPEGYGEIIGGSERISDPDLLLQRLECRHVAEFGLGQIGKGLLERGNCGHLGQLGVEGGRTLLVRDGVLDHRQVAGRDIGVELILCR